MCAFATNQALACKRCATAEDNDPTCICHRGIVTETLTVTAMTDVNDAGICYALAEDAQLQGSVTITGSTTFANAFIIGGIVETGATLALTGGTGNDVYLLTEGAKVIAAGTIDLDAGDDRVVLRPYSYDASAIDVGTGEDRLYVAPKATLLGALTIGDGGDIIVIGGVTVEALPALLAPASELYVLPCATFAGATDMAEMSVIAIASGANVLAGFVPVVANAITSLTLRLGARFVAAALEFTVIDADIKIYSGVELGDVVTFESTGDVAFEINSDVNFVAAPAFTFTSGSLTWVQHDNVHFAAATTLTVPAETSLNAFSVGNGGGFLALTLEIQQLSGRPQIQFGRGVSIGALTLTVDAVGVDIGIGAGFSATTFTPTFTAGASYPSTLYVEDGFFVEDAVSVSGAAGLVAVFQGAQLPGGFTNAVTAGYAETWALCGTQLGSLGANDAGLIGYTLYADATSSLGAAAAPVPLTNGGTLQTRLINPIFNVNTCDGLVDCPAGTAA